MSVRIERRLGAYEHFYETAEVESDSGKHYVANGYVVTTEEEVTTTDDQHSAVERFEPPFEEIDLHPYVATYLEDEGVLDG